MLSYASGFWPLFWGIIGGAAVLTVALSLVIADVPLPRRDRRRPASVIEMVRHHREEAGEHALAAGDR